MSNASSSDRNSDGGALHAVTLPSVLIGSGYLCYRAGCWLEAWLNNELSFPPNCEDAQQIFHCTDSMTSCNVFAYGLFYMLTGNDLHVTDFALGHHNGYQFDKEIPNKDKVHLFMFSWDEPSPWLGTETGQCHVCVCTTRATCTKPIAPRATATQFSTRCLSACAHGTPERTL